MSFKEQYWKYSLIIIILSLGIVLFIEFTPFLGGILGAVTLYALLRKQMLFLQGKKMKKSLIAFLLMVESVLLFLIPLSGILWLLIHKLQNLNVDTAAILTTFEHITDVVRLKTGYNLLDKSNVDWALSLLPTIGQVLLGGVSQFAVNIATLVIVLYFMLLGGRDMENYFYDLLPFKEKEKRNVLREINLIVTSNAIGIPLLGLIQGGIALIAFLIFGVPSPFFWGMLTCVATVIPLVGTALVWIPLVIYLLSVGEWPNALGLLAYSVLIITNIDNLIRFVLQKKMADTHPLVTVFGVIIGLSLFGFMGIIFGPLLLSVFILCISIFKKEYLDEKPVPDQSASALTVSAPNPAEE